MTRQLENWTPVATEYHPLTCGSIDGTDDYPHDKGILRALNSKYRPNKKVIGDQLCTIFVGRLNPETTEDALEEFFAKYGAIKRMRLVRDMISGFSKRYAFIEYKSGSSARKAAIDAHQKRIDDRRVLVEMECERELKGWIPRRFGGGFGGKKESGQLRFGGKDKPFKRPIILDSVVASRSSSSALSTKSENDRSEKSYIHDSRQFDSYHRHRDRSADRDKYYDKVSKERYRDTSDHRRRSDDRYSRADDRLRDGSQYNRDNHSRYGKDDRYKRDDVQHRDDDRHRERSRSQERNRKRKYRDEESDHRTLSEHKKSKHKHKHKKHKHRSRSRSQSK